MMAKETNNIVPEQFDVKFQLVTADDQTGVFEGIASVFGNPVATYPPTIIEQGAFTKTLQENAGRIKLLWQHDTKTPVGLPLELREVAEGLYTKGKVSQTTVGRDAIILMKDKVITELSIGFDAIKWEMKTEPNKEPVRHIKELKLYEVSLVTFAADSKAKIQSVHAAIPYQDLPVADDNQPWDAASARKNIAEWAGGSESHADMNWARYRKGFVWYDPSKPDSVDSYRLPIADVVEGKLRVVPRAVFAAVASLQGARGGTEIPEGEMETVRSHLSSYYRKCGRCAPWDTQSYDLTCRELLEPIASMELHEGRMLSKKNLEIVREVMAKLKELIDAASEGEEPIPMGQEITIGEIKQETEPPTEVLARPEAEPPAEALTPGLKELEQLVSLEAHAGRMLSKKNLDLVKEAIRKLTELVDAAGAEPDGDEAVSEGNEITIGDIKQSAEPPPEALTVGLKELEQLQLGFALLECQMNLTKQEI